MPQSKQDVQTREIASAHKTITDQDRQIAANAVSLFKDKKYEPCLQQVKKLSEQRPHDPRVLTNKSILEYTLSSFSKTDDFMKHMQNVKKQLEFSMVNSGDELDDIDRCFFLYNQAVLHFHLKQYKSALNLLDRLYKVIEPLGDVLAAKVCFLFVEVCLLNHQHDQAFGMITYIESAILAPNTLDDSEANQTAQFFKECQNKLRMFKARLYLVRGFYAQCKKELKLAMSGEGEQTETLFLKAHVECLRCNFQKSIKLLDNVRSDASIVAHQPLKVMNQNNLGCTYFHLKKYNIAISYFKRAFEENVVVMKNLPPIEKNNHLSGRPLQTLTINKRAEILFNSGVAVLFAGKPAEAFECLIQAQNVYQSNPRYWLRLAECCIGVHQKDIQEQYRSNEKKNSIVHRVYGNGLNRKLVLSPINFNPNNNGSQSSAMPSTSLEFASLCLSNASFLLPKDLVLEENMTKFIKNEKPVPGGEEKESVKRGFIGRIYVDAAPGHPIQTREIYNLKASVLCCQAFVAVCLGDYFKSAEHARALLRMSHITGPQKFLGHLYLAESLVKMDKIAEAIQELSPEHLQAYQTFNVEVQQLQTGETFPKTLNDARSMMLLNLASVYCIRSEYEKCKQILHQIASMVELPSMTKSHAVLLSVYCDLQLGKIANALSLIKRHEIISSGRLIDRVEAARTFAAAPQYSQHAMQPLGGVTSLTAMI